MNRWTSEAPSSSTITAQSHPQIHRLLPRTLGPTAVSSRLRHEKTLQLLHDLKAQGAKVIAIANAGDTEVPNLVSDTIFVEPQAEHLLPIAELVPLQLFSYFMALEKGVDVDRPRNLNKAVIEV